MAGEETNIDGGAYSTAMAQDGDTALPRAKPQTDGEPAPAEKDVPDDSELNAGEFVEEDEVLTPDSDPKDISDDGDEHVAAADEQATIYKNSI